MIEFPASTLMINQSMAKEQESNSKTYELSFEKKKIVHLSNEPECIKNLGNS
jgi:hypothetical protein